VKWRVVWGRNRVCRVEVVLRDDVNTQLEYRQWGGVTQAREGTSGNDSIQQVPTLTPQPLLFPLSKCGVAGGKLDLEWRENRQLLSTSLKFTTCNPGRINS
jgi:hypothetical protein